MVEKARKNFDEDEIEILRRIYAEGREDGDVYKRQPLSLVAIRLSWALWGHCHRKV